MLRGVDYRKDRRVKHNIVIRWRPDLPKKRDEPWFLMTDLDDRAERLCQLYGRRMSIEELFRDGKSRRNGQSLRDTRIRQARTGSTGSCWSWRWRTCCWWAWG